MRPVAVYTLTVAMMCGAGLGAQPAPRRAAIDAVVTDTGLVPMAGATVAIVGTAIRVSTGANGRFLIHTLPAGRIQLAILKLGYRSHSALIDIGDSDTLRLAFMLESGRSQQLAGITVTERGRSSRLADFDRRREAGNGQFITAEDIAKRNTPFATELMRTLKGVNVKGYPDGGGSLRYFAMSPRSGTRDLYVPIKRGMQEQTIIGCPMEVYVDGIIMVTPFNLDYLPTPSSIAGVEMYTGDAKTPIQYGSTDRRCGVILVWTKDGS